MPGITVRGLVKRYGAVPALDGIGFEVGEGELLSLLGPSGCGKTTTLRCIAGLEEGDAGTIEIGGTLASDYARRFAVPPEERGIGMVFQSYAVWPHMTVYRNIAYPLVARRRPKSAIDPAVRKALQLVGMADFADRAATDLSGGQQQRVALARALVAEPRVLLLDEPLSNLDAKLRDQMRIELRQIQRRLGLTAIYVTHDQSEAMALSDRIIVMNRGRIEQIGTPREIYESSASAFVADFVGASSFLRGTVGSREAGNLVALALAGGGRILVPDKGLSGEILVSLRPHFCSVRAPDAQPPQGENALAGIIEHVTYLGERSQAHVAVGGQSLSVYLRPDAPFGAGDRVLVTFAPRDCLPLAGVSMGGSSGAAP